MSTVLVKFKNEKVTPEEAAAAQADYELPRYFSFLHWSTSNADDLEVAELNAGSTGVVVTENQTYYPVIATSEFTSEREVSSYTYKGVTASYVGWSERYDYDYGSYVSEEASTLSKTDESGILEAAAYKRYISMSVSVSTYPTLLYDPSGSSSQLGTTTKYKYAAKDYIEFGFIDLDAVKNAGAKGYSAVSETSGITYYLKVIYNETISSTMSNGTVVENVYPFSFRLYAKIDGVIRKVDGNNQSVNKAADINDVTTKDWSFVARFFDRAD